MATELSLYKKLCLGEEEMSPGNGGPQRTPFKKPLRLEGQPISRIHPYSFSFWNKETESASVAALLLH